MTTWSAIATVPGEAAAEALGEAMDRLEPGPTGVGVFEVEDGSGLWEVGGYFDARPDEAGLALLAAVQGARPFAVSRIEERDWVSQVRRELVPVEAGRFTVYGAHDAHRVGPHRLGLRIEAAMAFGTGHHGTTLGCLTLLDRWLRRGARPARAADVGCGTGVLAMAAARALHLPCVATDIDPVAVATARANVAANGLAPWIRIGRAVGFEAPLLRERSPYDLVFANILAHPLKRLAPSMAAHAAPGGSVILSGLLAAQAAGVEAVYRGHGFGRRCSITLAGWTSLHLVRNEKRPPRGRGGRMRAARAW
ncbi:MAG TPA: 50S ribosomal protein L11 methyltransferase [Thermohalobaculum sp.]|nr:50S ribosomal protein L11 methyltransferase [Thermohalobaculum sp.]